MALVNLCCPCIIAVFSLTQVTHLIKESFMNGYIVTIIIAFIFGPILTLPILIVGLFNIMDLMLFSFPILFFCIQGYKKERKIKDAFKGVIPGLIVSLILMAVVLFVKNENDCSNKYESGDLPAAVCETLKGPGFR
ncbi:TPA: hypothetical protein ACTW6Y_005248 [Klebsiella pneumoniae]